MNFISSREQNHLVILYSEHRHEPWIEDKGVPFDALYGTCTGSINSNQLDLGLRL